MSTRSTYLNLTVNTPIQLLDEPSGYVSALAKNCLGHQMRHAAHLAARELEEAHTPHVLQLVLDDERTPSHWELYADGQLVASGSGEYVRTLLVDDARAFLQLALDAVRTADLPPLTADEYRLLLVAQALAKVEAAAC